MLRKILVLLIVLCSLLTLETESQYSDYGYRAYSRHYTAPHNPNLPAEKYLCFIVGFCMTPIGHLSPSSKFRQIYEWNQVDFAYDTDTERENDIYSHAFKKGDIAPIDVDAFYGEDLKPKVFVAIPRFQAGVPATLGTVEGYTGNEPRIQPYPSWEYHRNPELCSRHRLLSVFRVKIDNCGRLWVVDTGKILDNQVCKPQVVAFNLKTNQEVHRFELDSSFYTDASLFVTPAVEDNGSCSNTFVYLADCQANAIVVLDVAQDKAWKVIDKTMYPYPDFGTYSIQGDSFDLMDGVLGMDVSPYNSRGLKKLFFHAMSSGTENWVYTAYLKNASLFEEGPSSHPDIFHTFRGKRSSQSAAEAIDKNGIAFFGQMSETSINCWNTETEYGPQNIGLVERNEVTLQFPSGVKIVNHPRGYQELWVLTSRFQRVATGTLTTSEVNFRIQAVKTDDAVRGTKCKKSKGSHGGHSHGSHSSGMATNDGLVFSN